VLHHAVKDAVYGFAMIEDLRRHGCELSIGTLYPILHGLEQRDLLTSTRERDGGTERRVCHATPARRKALAAAKIKVRELFGDLFEHEDRERIMTGSLSGYGTGAIDWRARIFRHARAGLVDPRPSARRPPRVSARGQSETGFSRTSSEADSRISAFPILS
jgi:PadR family transcriptional regulator, regulatory protein PadR